jgi:RIO kinase 1
MKPSKELTDPEDFDLLAGLPRVKNLPLHKIPSGRNGKPHRKPKRSPPEILAELAGAEDDRQVFEFTYQASRHERGWLVNSLGSFYQQHWLDDVLRLVKGGKEASVYQCIANPAMSGRQRLLLAAKVYRPRQFRQLRNDHLYREGRQNLDSEGHTIVDGGMLHAMHKRTEYGKQLLHTSWIEHEYQTLQILHAAGADVPAPYASGGNAILMAYIGGEDLPAPPLSDLSLTPQEARPLFERLLYNIEIMLANGRVHADLSAYNILYWEGQITLIDFPQAISPRENRNAYAIFERDLRRVCEYFERQGVPSRPRELAARMWTAFKYALRPEVDPALLDGEDAQDRAYWQKTIDRGQ